MTDYEKLLINVENQDGPKFVMVLDNHPKHIFYHLRYILRRGMIRHCLEHVKLYARFKKMGIPSITLDKVMNHYDT